MEITKKAWKRISKTVKDTKKQWGYLLALNGRLTKVEEAMGFCPECDKKVLRKVWKDVEKDLNDLNDIKLRKPNTGDTLSDCIIKEDEGYCKNFDDGLQQKYSLWKINGDPVDPEAFYFVLKIGGKLESPIDHAHNKASRRALSTYADNIGDILPKLSKDLIDELNGDFMKHGKND